jgi:hypothetical protein
MHGHAVKQAKWYLRPACGPPLSSRHLNWCIGASVSVECSAITTVQLPERRFCFWTERRRKHPCAENGNKFG